jgi:uncharacterized repeat protein (TIGR03803 family)
LAGITLTTLATFNGSNGKSLYAGLISDGKGNLYGTTEYGGANNDGTVFEVPAGGGTPITLATFNGSNGGEPLGGLISDAMGNVYGTTFIGGANNVGTVFEVPAGGGTPITLATFNGSNGSGPEFSLISDAAGNLYGATQQGGAYGYGTVFEVPAGGGAPITLATFNGSNGYRPLGGLIFDAKGNLYGATEFGGARSNYGTVFEVPAGGGTPITLATFGYLNEGPFAGLISDAAGNLYGTTYGGGTNRDGTVFEVPAGGGGPITLAAFSGSNGQGPAGGLIADAAGNLYGATVGGGANNDGTVFEVPAGGGTPIALATFNGGNGASPYDGLIEDAAGNLYGTTEGGGANNDGTVFELSGTGFVVPEPSELAWAACLAAPALRRRRR